ncbi:MAG: STN domain-containing protein, partial [Candidatus Neomarinimicrobiota bacterium]
MNNHLLHKQLILLPIGFLISACLLFSQTTEPPPLVSINLKDASFNTVLKILSEKTGLKFVADPEIQERKITVNLSGVTPEDAITAIMNSSGLAYRKIDGIDIYFVGDIRKIQQHTVIKNY